MSVPPAPFASTVAGPENRTNMTAATAAVPLSPTTRGMLCMTAGVLVLTTQDAITKWLTDSYHPGEIMFYRGFFSFLPIFLFATREGGLSAFRAKRLGPNLIRGLFALITSALNVLAFGMQIGRAPCRERGGPSG